MKERGPWSAIITRSSPSRAVKLGFHLQELSHLLVLVDRQVVAVGVADDEEAAAGGFHDLGFDGDVFGPQGVECGFKVFHLKGGADTTALCRRHDVGNGERAVSGIEFDPALALLREGVIHGAGQADDALIELLGPSQVGGGVGDERDFGDVDAHILILDPKEGRERKAKNAPRNAGGCGAERRECCAATFLAIVPLES